ncbi:hypothetical protein [Anaeromyxobacter sp. PSR-1]|uniref:hypothetical protein n=1 Tax=Anaeromyxobacter sp. PSR-1 TaxID=1300915 RepID=UPI0005E498CA|nr:hypothetical protein [Anaeromyxobacter sp. PSR-1]GAO03719.1 hypothetical protein PSR1_02603 [Anaeromyxobacter sp. PSR-1]
MFTRHTGIGSGALVVALSSALALLAPAVGRAQPPEKRACGDLDPYARLTCRQAALAAQLGYTADVAFADGTKLQRSTPRDRVTHIRNAKANAARAVKNHDREAFRRHARNEALGVKGGGHLMPLSAGDDGNGDGICDYEQGNLHARCAAVEPDASGNPQACNPETKNRGKARRGLECDTFLDVAEASGDAADMRESAEELDATYGSTEDALIEMNLRLDDVNASTTAGGPTAAAGGCIVPTVDPRLADAVPALRLVAATLAGIARQVADVGGQDALGFNALGITLIPETAAAIANVVYIGVDEIHKQESGAVQGAIMACVNQTAGDLAELRSLVEQLVTLVQQEHTRTRGRDDDNTAALSTQVEEVRREVVDLLNTPLGQRPVFPGK